MQVTKKHRWAWTAEAIKKGSCTPTAIDPESAIGKELFRMASALIDGDLAKNVVIRVETGGDLESGNRNSYEIQAEATPADAPADFIHADKLISRKPV